MKGILRFALGALCALTIAGVYAQPPGLAGLVWLDNNLEFDLNAGNLVATGALSTTISLGNPDPVCITKATGTLNINLDLTALTGFPNLPSVTLVGTASCWRQPDSMAVAQPCRHQSVCESCLAEAQSQHSSSKSQPQACW
jgi:hypothetical protein